MYELAPRLVLLVAICIVAGQNFSLTGADQPILLQGVWLDNLLIFLRNHGVEALYLVLCSKNYTGTLCQPL
jgi:hypothetical protein